MRTASHIISRRCEYDLGLGLGNGSLLYGLGGGLSLSNGSFLGHSAECDVDL